MNSTSHGYSGKPLHLKLGMKAGMRCLIVDAPEYYPQLIEGAGAVKFMKRARSADFIHLFCRCRADFLRRIDGLLAKPVDGGMVWVSWPKKSSSMYMDLTENDIRSHILKTQWVDVKVCAVDQDWSGLKFLRRRS